MLFLLGSTDPDATLKTLLAAVGANIAIAVLKWFDDRWTKRKLAKKTEETKVEATRTVNLAKEEVKQEIQKNTEISERAFTAANEINRKILECQQHSQRAVDKSLEALGIAARQSVQIQHILTEQENKRATIHWMANNLNKLCLHTGVEPTPPPNKEHLPPNNPSET